MIRRESIATVLIACGVLLVAIAGKWRAIEQWGSDVPYMDQWVGEAENTLVPWAEGRFDFKYTFWWPHNEHRVGWTRLFSLCLLEVNGQWDPLLGITLNACVHAAIGMLLVWWLRAFLAGPGWVTLPTILGIVLIVPVAWENTLQSFQIQAYLLLLSGLIALAWMPISSPRSWRFWCGTVSAIFGIGTMASSFLAPASVLVVIIARASSERRITREAVFAAATSATVAAVGLLSVNAVPGHAGLKASSALEFLSAFGAILAWPWHDLWLAGVATNIPVATWLILRLRNRREPWKESEWLLLGLLIWAILQSAAVAYSRGNGDFLSFRYADFYSLLLVVNAAALGAIWQMSRTRAGMVMATLAAAWITVSAVGVVRRSNRDSDPWLESMSARFTRYATHIRTYLVTQDKDSFLALQPFADLPFPDNASLKRMLDSPALQTILPAGIRKPLSLESDEGTVNFAPTVDASSPLQSSIRHVWTTTGNQIAVFRSKPLTLGRTRGMRIHFLGDREIRPDAIKLETDDGRIVPLSGVRFAGNRWQTAHIFAPQGARSVRLVAETSPRGGSLRFSEPIEVGTWTWAARQARKSWSWLFLFGAGALLAGVALGLGVPVRYRPRTATS